MLYTLFSKIAEGLTSCCGWVKEEKRRNHERRELLEKMTDEEFYDYLRKQIDRAKRLSSCNNCC